MKIENHTKKLNDKFKKATAAQKRVIIAQDALDQIKSKRFKPESGNFLKVKNLEFNPNGYHTSEEAELGEKSFQKVFVESPKIKCVGCALGALFLSTTVVNNNSTVCETIEEGSDLGEMIQYRNSFSNGLHKFFSEEQLVQIEYCFEGGAGYFGSYNISSTEKRVKLDEFISKHRGLSATNRLVAILNNIIENEGKFKP